MSSTIDTLFRLFSSSPKTAQPSEEQSLLIKSRPDRNKGKPGNPWDPSYLVVAALQNAGEEESLSRLNAKLGK